VQEAGLVGSTVMTDIFPVQVPYESGHLLPPERPGLGVEMDDEAALAACDTTTARSPRLRRSDGSFTNW